MKYFNEVNIITKKLDFTICDNCGIKINEYDLSNEMVNISNTFGYSSKQDCTNISFDICEACFMKLIKNINYRKKDVGAWSNE